VGTSGVPLAPVTSWRTLSRYFCSLAPLSKKISSVSEYPEPRRLSCHLGTPDALHPRRHGVGFTFENLNRFFPRVFVGCSELRVFPQPVIKRAPANVGKPTSPCDVGALPESSKNGRLF
jgi:hypothetical protein